MLRNFILVILCLALLPNTQIKAECENTFVTRAELADAVMKTYEYITQEFSFPIIEQSVFNDISDSSFQFRILQAHIKGIMNGVGDDKFLPDKELTRCEAAVAVYRLTKCINEKYNLTLEEKKVDISDIETSPDWGKEAIMFTVSVNIMTTEQSKFYPERLITQNELNEITDMIKDIFVVCDDVERIDFQTFLERMSP